PAVGAVVAVPPADRRAVAQHLRELRPWRLHPAHDRLVGAARPAQEAAADDGRAGGPHHDQAVHGHLDDDRGAADAVLRARRHACGPGPVRAVLRGAGVAAAGGPAPVRRGLPAAAQAAPRGDLVKPEPYDPLRLCVYATVALLAWLFGP